MLKLMPIVLMLLVPVLPVSAKDDHKVWDDPVRAAAEDPDFKVQGEYASRGVGFQVIALGHGKFTVVQCAGGLPGDGFNGHKSQTNDVDLTKARELIGDAKQVHRQSHTLGAAPPAGAIVLFDGSKATFETNWKPGARMADGGLLMEGATTTRSFGDFTLHLEFRLPYKPEARGQGRGNSGLYMQGRYEVQMLDSFGLTGEDNECGGIYKIAKPALNVCYPPLSWQTYDVEFTAAKFDSSGKKTANAVVTVRHNDVVIHDHVELTHTTTAAPVKDERGPGPIFLQNHGNPVRYCNIWIITKE